MRDSFIIRSISPATRQALDQYKRESGIVTDSKALGALVRTGSMMRKIVRELESELSQERSKSMDLRKRIRSYLAALDELRQ